MVKELMRLIKTRFLIDIFRFQVAYGQEQGLGFPFPRILLRTKVERSPSKVN
ncbi:Uncharacterised protein [Sphingobacterium daejeonense]|nr:Uncharacterised protein [Sphingobacterium daejeonense]